MQRVFTKDVGTNFHKGDIKDYPITVWRDIERVAGKALDAFSQPYEDVVRAGVEAALGKVKGTVKPPA